MLVVAISLEQLLRGVNYGVRAAFVVYIIFVKGELSYNGENCAYNALGTPTTYRGNALEWQYGNRLTKYGATTFAYDGAGRRVSKGNITFTYDSDGRLIKQSDGLEFIYDHSGITGVKYNGNIYFYRKDAQGNIISLLDNNGNVVVEYKYDAWGNHGAEVADEEYVALAENNPFRYRSYYFDSETDLYFLQTRYYDPEVGRFISRDSIEYADPETICGLNLYAYCGNNPVMNVDPDGTFLLSFLLAGLAGAVVGGVINGVTSAAKGDSFWGGFLSGALVGGALGGALILGGATMLAVAGKAVVGFVVASTVSAKLALLAGTAVTTFAVTAGVGMGAYAINESMNGRTISVSEMLRQGIMTGIKGIGAYMTGMLLATVGVYNYLLTGNKWSMTEKIKMMLIRSATSFVFQIPWKLGLK